MSDLNDFFAKKDRKKKKAAAKSALAAATQEVKPAENATDAGNGASPPPKQPDDGWIEIEDPKGAQVNTGGRTVVEFRRDAEEKEVNGDGTTQTEKFSGWAKTGAQPAAEGPEEGDQKAPVQASSSAFPSLADAAKVKNVPTYSVKSSTPSGLASTPGRRRFINSNPEKLRQKLAERAAAQK